ncbi:hypothetical protein K439DRAFT_1398065 [Ramaria rubella]|nr:hypothetical protein K439DRAFT_1398065 [Ramaria rubella]
MDKPVDPNRAIRIQRATEYPKQIWLLFASFIGLLTLFHIGALLLSWRHKRNAQSYRALPNEENFGNEYARSSSNTKASFRRIPSALATAFRIVAYRMPFPSGGGHTLNVAEITISVGYIIALFTWEFINCMNVTTGVQLDVSYWANRAGDIVATNLPLLVLLAGKNNIISLLTGISYEKLNILHRVAARICLILVWVHFGGRVTIGLHKDTAITNLWVQIGIATATAYTLLVLISIRPLRSRFYEAFFYSHFMLVLLIVIGSFFHIRGARGFTPYLTPTLILWILDRALRLFRVLWYNRSRSTSASLDATSSVELLSPTMVRLTLKRHMTWRAGQNVFITMPAVSSLPFEAHPFTIATIPRHPSVSDTPNAQGFRSHSDQDDSCDLSSYNEPPPSQRVNELVFYVRMREGFTKRLRDIVERESTDGGRVRLSTYIDGPYGSPPDLNAYDSVILIAGGSGISYILPLLQDIVRNSQQGKSACRSVLFIWATRDRGDFSWIWDTIQESLGGTPSSLRLRFRLHVTQTRSDTLDNEPKHPEDASGTADPDLPSSSSDSDASGDHDQLLHDDRISIVEARPRMRAILEKELDGVRGTGTISVNVAGPVGLAADVREALRFELLGPQAILKGAPDVTLHVETYGIA